jgi:hypothetical protein
VTSAVVAVEQETTHDFGDPGEPGSTATGDDIDPADTASPPPAGNEPDAETPSTIITEFASQTSRRMGRTLFADER